MKSRRAANSGRSASSLFFHEEISKQNFIGIVELTSYQTRIDNMRILFLMFLVTVASCEAAAAQNQSINELRKMFDYDQKLPLDVKEVGVRDSDGVRIHDINYASPKFGRVTADLVEPAVKGKYAGIVFGHWGYGNRTEFLAEAILYARAGVVSLLIDYPWVRPAPWRRSEPGEKPEAVRDNYAATVIDLRRGIDLLQARSDVDSNRIAYAGHSTGAQWGAILSAIDKRLKAAVLMGGIPTEATILLESDDPEFVDYRKNTPKEQIDKYFKTIGVMDAINYVPYAGPNSCRRHASKPFSPLLFLSSDTDSEALCYFQPSASQTKWFARYGYEAFCVRADSLI